jgi:nucleoid-associated protein YgaU
MAAKGDRPAAAKSEEGGQAAAAPEAQAGTETQAAAAEAPAQDSGAAPKVAEAAGTADAAQAEEKQVAVAEQPKTETPAPASAATRTARIAVEAVEIEGRKVFVAGRADAGKTVRVYANDILLGQAVTSEGGRFLIEAEKDLPVGDYIVRADMLSADNADVEARAAVPFEREPGEKLAAVAATESAQEETSDKTAEGAAMAKSEDAGAASQEQTTLSGDVAAKDGGGSAAKSETTEVAALDNGGGASASGGDARVAGDTKPDDAAKAADGGSMQAAVSEGGPSDSETDAVEATAPKLQNVGSAVIIRRGDTLWRLSRRVYGRGIRYTTIYLANEEQIADPDMIWPGQVFSVPSETDEGEAADMSAVAEQVAGPDAASENVATR